MIHTPAAVVARLDDLGVVSTTIDGKGPYHFLLDTGAGITVLTPAFAREAGLAGGGSVQATGSGGTVHVSTTVVHEIAVGNAIVRDVEAAIIPLPLDLTYQGDYGTIDGILGYTFLSRFAVTIDIAHHRVTLAIPSAYRTPSGAVSEVADLSDHTPIVQARADGSSGAFKLDTGDNGTLTLTAAFVKAYGFARRYPGGQPELFEGVGGFERAIAVRLQRFTLGGATVPNEAAALSLATTGILAGNGLAGNIGNDVLRRFVFTVDYARRRVDFEASGLLDAYVPYKRTGLHAARLADGTMRVIAVDPSSAASNAHVRVGDTLVAVNGYPVARLDNAQLAETTAADSVSYTIRRGNRERDVTFALTDLLPPR